MLYLLFSLIFLLAVFAVRQCFQFRYATSRHFACIHSEGLDAGIFAQLRSKTLKDGFYLAQDLGRRKSHSNRSLSKSTEIDNYLHP